MATLSTPCPACRTGKLFQDPTGLITCSGCRKRFGANKSSFAWEGWSQDRISRFDLFSHIAMANEQSALELLRDAENHLDNQQMFLATIAQSAVAFGRASMAYENLKRIVDEGLSYGT